jgi:hypothetical protein
MKTSLSAIEPKRIAPIVNVVVWYLDSTFTADLTAPSVIFMRMVAL